MRAEERIPSIIDALYEGTLDSGAWDRAMLAMAHLVSGYAALLYSFNPSTGEVRRDENHGFDPDAVVRYRRHWVAEDIRLAPGIEFAIGEPMFDSRLLPVKTLQASALYNEFLIPMDAPWILAHWLDKGPDRVVALTIQGTKRRGQFDARDGERIRPLLPHLRRALDIRDRLEYSHVRADTLAKSVDNLSFGVLVLDAGGRILEANLVAQDLLRNEDGIYRNIDKTLGLRDPAGSQLRQWMSQGTPPADNMNGLLHVQRHLAQPLSVLVTRLPESPWAWIRSGLPSWMLLLFDPDRQLPLSAELIAQDLGLSPREAEVTAMLASGYDLRRIALALRISIYTARTHLKSIYRRTGIRSQAELIKRVATGPASIHLGTMRR